MQTTSPAVPVGTWIQSYSGLRVDAIQLTPDQVSVRDVAHALAQACRFTGHSCRFYSVGEHSLYVADVGGLSAAMGLAGQRAGYRPGERGALPRAWRAATPAGLAACLADNVVQLGRPYAAGLRLPGLLAVGAVLMYWRFVGSAEARQLARRLAVLLVHDGAEAYLADIATPTKRRLPDYRSAEARAEAAVLRAMVPGWPDHATEDAAGHIAGLTGLHPDNLAADLKSADVAVLLCEKSRLLISDLPDWSPSLPRDFAWDRLAHVAVSPLPGMLSTEESAWYRMRGDDPHAPAKIERAFLAAHRFLIAVANEVPADLAAGVYLGGVL